MSEKAEDEFGDLSTRFLHWLTRNGTVISPKIKLADLRKQKAGRGVVAVDEIDVDEELFSVPNSSILTVETSSLPRDVTRDLTNLWHSLIVAMVYEFRQCTASRWQPYFDILPEHFDTLMYWSTEELETLEGSAVLSKIGKRTADSMFKKHIIPIIRQHAASFKAEPLSDQKLLELCHRMGSLIMSYAFDLEPATQTSKDEDDGWEEDSDTEQDLEKGMIPLADMLNADADRNNAKLFYEGDRVVMKAISPIRNCDEIFNDYGPLPRADVLRRYGYITNNYAKYDVVEVSLHLVKRTAEEEFKMQDNDFQERIRYLGEHDVLIYPNEHDVLDEGYDIYRESSEEGQFSDEFKILLSILVMPKEHFEKLKGKDKLPKPELSQEAAELLQSILVRRLAMYPAIEEETRHITSGENRTENTNLIHSTHERRKRMAAEVIEGEKAVLREAEEAVQQLLRSEKKRKAPDVASETLPGQLSKKTKNASK